MNHILKQFKRKFSLSMCKDYRIWLADFDRYSGNSCDWSCGNFYCLGGAM